MAAPAKSLELPTGQLHLLTAREDKEAQGKVQGSRQATCALTTGRVQIYPISFRLE